MDRTNNHFKVGDKVKVKDLSSLSKVCPGYDEPLIICDPDEEDELWYPPYSDFAGKTVEIIEARWISGESRDNKGNPLEEGYWVYLINEDGGILNWYDPYFEQEVVTKNNRSKKK
jgi:hypothetical protein